MRLNPPFPLDRIRCPRTIRRFLSHIQLTPDGRWLWTGAKDRKGYGRFRLGPHTLSAHRISFAIFVGPIPADHHIHHILPDPSNVHPDNLQAVTPLENTRHSNARHRRRPPSAEPDIPI